jgi:hypothetical protein
VKNLHVGKVSGSEKLNKKKASFSIVLVFLVIGFLEITLNLLALAAIIHPFL